MKKEKTKPVRKPESNSAVNISLLVILLLTVIVFSRGVTNIFIGLDDPVYIDENPFIKSLSWESIQKIFSSFYNANYHPFTTLLFAIEYKLFGNGATAWHVVSLLFHLLNIVLVFSLLRSLSKNSAIALGGALIFAIHPMHVESVVWISEQKDVLYSFFFLLGLNAYLKYLSVDRKKYLFYSMLLFLSSLFSKPAAVVFPLILLAIDYYYKRPLNAKSILEKVPFFLLSIVFGIISILSQSEAGAISGSTMISYSLFERVFVVSFSILYYVFKFFIPADICVIHYAPKVLPAYFYVCPIFLLLITWLLWMRKNLRRPLLFGWMFYLASVILIVQIIPVGFVLVSERYSYLSYFGLIFIMGTSLQSISIKKFSRPAIIFVALIFSYVSFSYIKNWKSSVSLFTDIVNKNPGSAYAYNSLGKIQVKSDMTEPAKESFTKAIELDPTITESYFCRANIYFNQKVYDKAESDYLTAERLNPSYPDNLNNLAFLYSETNRMNEAISYYGKAIALKPTEYLYQRRGTCYTILKDYSNAASDYSNAIGINPANPESYFNRGVCYFYKQQITDACSDWRKASSMNYEKANSLLQKYCQ